MWSLGVVTVQLLTGKCFLSESEYSGESEDSRARLACWRVLQRMESSQEEWANVGPRPKDFVKKLIVPDAEKRMTVQQALDHPWFTNKTHRALYEDLYKRAIRNWKPRTRSPNTIEDIRLPVPKQATVESSRGVIVSDYFTRPSRAVPSTEQTTYKIPPSIPERNELPSTLHSSKPGAIITKAPIAKMYRISDTHDISTATYLKRGVAERSKPLASGFTAPCQRAANDRATGDHKAYANSIEQTLPEKKKRRSHGVRFAEQQDHYARPTKRTKCQHIS
jgi:serine/threonine protein kinase